MHDISKVCRKVRQDPRNPIGIRGIQSLSMLRRIQRSHSLAFTNPLADVINGPSPGDHEDPSLSAAERLVERGRTLPNLQKDILKDVLGLLPIADQFEGQSEDARRVAVIERREGDRVALRNPPQEVFVTEVHSV